MSYQDVKALIPKGHKKIANNTYLTLEEPYLGDSASAEYVDMRLHGNLVASFHKNCLYLYSGSYYTTTTKSRLNLALDIAKINDHLVGSPYLPSRGGWKKIYQVDWQWYYGNYHKYDPKFYDGIKIDYTGKIIT